ncbi:Uncharacterised protein [Mycobacteroides abscessus subsp. abscessus]|nr:Uncharacterised protein [Mycobacteroides abscessus subsp. abscessus]
MERERRLQAGHWYLVADEHGQADIRAYMDDGWYPLTPEPKEELSIPVDRGVSGDLRSDGLVTV